MNDDPYLIHELARRAGTTVRTIRYYTDEGLLPQPVIVGKYATYAEIYLKRLELIRRMKEAYLPLREIRDILRALSDEEVEQRFAQGAETTTRGLRESPESYPTRSATSALDYISRLMGEQEGSPSAPPGDKAAPAPTPPPAFEGQEQWRRVPLAPGVELSLREPLDPDQARRIQRLIELAQKLLGSNIRAA